jgi:hypothetical protein
VSVTPGESTGKLASKYIAYNMNTIEADVKLLEMFYRSAQRKIISELNSGTAYSQLERKNILARIDKELNDLSGKTKKWVDTKLPAYYDLGRRQSIQLVSSVDNPQGRQYLDKIGAFDSKPSSGLVAQSTNPYNRAFEVITREIRGAEQKKAMGELMSILPQNDPIASKIALRLNNDYNIPYPPPVSAPPISYAFSQLDKEALNAVTQDTFMKFGESMSAIRRQSSDLLSYAQKQRVQALFAEGKITRLTLKQIKDNIAGQLRSGMIALKDKSGKTWSIDAYASMLARTKMTETTNLGLENQLIKSGYDLVQVTRHGSVCKLCAPWEGKILSITGATPGYPTVAQARAEGLSHPNCKHREVPYHEEFATQTKVWSTEYKKYVSYDTQN